MLAGILKAQKAAPLQDEASDTLYAHNCADLALCILKMGARTRYSEAAELVQTTLDTFALLPTTDGSHAAIQALLLQAEILELTSQRDKVRVRVAS